ncbi:MAG: cytochrome P450 [Polyangiaceae bacterium]|nr:cytochrome P450 [Polyangiaceae bacterium]
MARLSGFARMPIPGPWALPFYGTHANAVRLLLDPIPTLERMWKEHGDVVAVAAGNPALVCAFGAGRNREVLSNPALFGNDTNFFVEIPADSSVQLIIKGLPFRDGDDARRHRRLMMPAFQRSALDGYAGDIASITDKALAEWPVGAVTNVAVLTQRLVQRIAVQCFFGLPCTGDRTLGDIIAEVADLFVSPLTLALPYPLPGTPFKRLCDLTDEMIAALSTMFEEKRKAAPTHDVLSLMLHAREEDGSSFSENDLIGEAITLYVAGHDTQAKTLAWTLFLLEQHPTVLADLVDEVSGVLRGGLPSVEDIPKMPLLDRVLKESMRVLAPVPTLFLRVARGEAPLGAYTLPEGARVIISPFLTHRDPAIYTEPRRFLPSRWEHIQPTAYEYLPFGAGPRTCIGAAFATMALRLMLAMIVQRFRLTLAYGAKITAHAQSNLLWPKHGMPMLIAPQDRRFAPQKHVRGEIGQLVDLPMMV